jgi:hypothetical protein
LAPASPERRPSTAMSSDGAGDVKEKSRAHFARTKPGRHCRFSSRVASVAEAKHRSLPASIGRAARCVVLRTSATRGFFRCGFGRTQEPGDRRTGRHLPMRHGTAPRVGGLRSAGLQGTTRRPNSRKVRWSKRASLPTPIPRGRRRSERSEWFHPGHSRGNGESQIRSEGVPGVRGRRVCYGPPAGRNVVV